MEAGAIVAERFEIESRAATGGMGVVYRAKDRETSATVALKVMAGQSAREMDRFSFEALLLAELRHPGIVRYIAHGSTRSGELYLAMAWLEGEDLSSRIARAGMTVDESVTLGRGVADALSAAHAKGIVHRDIKPGNLFLEDGDVARVKVLDFGIARLGYGRTFATRTGMMLGTPGYMAPEQAQGRKDVGARADVFSLGCVLYECLTGRPAFTGEHLMAVLSRILLEEAPRVRELRPDVPPALDQLVASMLSKDPAGRPQDAARVAEALQALGPASSTVRAPALVRRQALTTSEQRLICAVLATTALAEAEPDSSMGTDATLTPEMALLAIARQSVSSHDDDTVASERPGGSLGGLSELGAAASAYGGRMERLADGSLLVVHTGGGTATDLAARAARSALAMRALLPGLPIALATGRAVVSERLPIGEAVESAARLLRGAKRSQADGADLSAVRLDEVSAGLLDGHFELRREATGTVLVGEHSAGESMRTLLGRPTPCVGRERQLGTIAAMFEEGLSEPAARAVLITGPPGAGKSHLARELLRRLVTSAGPLQVWMACGDPMRAGSSFGMLAEIIRQAAGIEGGGPLELRQRKLRARVSSCAAAAEAERITVFLCELIGAPFPSDQIPVLAAARKDAILMGDQMRRAFEDWLDAECARAPVLFVLEDLHSGDLPTVKFIDAALRHLRDRPLLVLALARPEISRVFPGLWAERAVTEVRLAELGRRAAEQLVRLSLGKDVHDELVARLVERAAGNPFYLEELIRAVAAGRSDDALPGTVLAMVQARLEQLDPSERRVLRAASIFGDVFWTAGLSALLGGSEHTTAIRDRLHDLSEHELIVRRTTRRLQDQDEYAFRSSVVREAAYASLTDADRILGHKLAAAWLSAMGETDAKVLAAHFERGGEYLDAALWYGKAADSALEGNDFASVIERVEQAVACGATGETAGLLRLRQAEAHRWRGEFADAERRGLEAIRLLPRGGDAWMGAVGEMATVLGKLGHIEPVVELGEELLALQSTIHRPSDPHITALSRTSTALLLMGQPDLAESLFRVLEHAVEDPSQATPTAAAWLWRARAFRAPFRGETGMSARCFAWSAEQFDKAGDLRNACLQRANVGASCLEVGDYEAAEQALRPTIAEAERMGAQHIVSSAKRDLGYALARLGRLQEAHRVELEAVVEFRAHGDRRLEGVGRDELAFILMQQGDLEGAEREARAAVERLEVAPAYLCHALATFSRVLLRRGRAADALEQAGRSLAILQEVGALEEGEGLVRLVLAEALRAVGREAEGRQVLSQACAEIDRRAAQIEDPGARQTFRHHIPEHVETVALAAEWLGRRPE